MAQSKVGEGPHARQVGAAAARSSREAACFMAAGGVQCRCDRRWVNSVGELCCTAGNFGTGSSLTRGSSLILLLCMIVIINEHDIVSSCMIYMIPSHAVPMGKTQTGGLKVCPRADPLLCINIHK